MIKIFKGIFRFLRDEQKDKEIDKVNLSKKDYGEILAKKYYDKLYKEFTIVDLSKYKTGKYRFLFMAFFEEFIYMFFLDFLFDFIFFSFSIIKFFLVLSFLVFPYIFFCLYMKFMFFLQIFYNLVTIFLFYLSSFP